MPDSQRAWHAGRSRWHHYAGLNASSLGIEIVNLGYDEKDAALPAHLRHWQPYPPAQIAALGASRRDLVERYQIPPPRCWPTAMSPRAQAGSRPRFPWRELALLRCRRLARRGRVAELRQTRSSSPDALQWQQQLLPVTATAYPSTAPDEQSRAVLRAFQLHFRSALVTGEPDAECQAILTALLERYFPEPG